ncbi:MAG: hypothetical protein KME09_13145 [Pleurocapsa minor HA4230-MV1]|nr:hypothetical protein [Pleurocapsa minor HA4230-MV1]
MDIISDANLSYGLYDVINAISYGYASSFCQIKVNNNWIKYDPRVKSIDKIKNKLINKLSSNTIESFWEIPISGAWFTDYFNDVIIHKYDSELLRIYKSIIIDCKVIIPFRAVCFVCDRPIKILLDNCNNLHAKGEAAIEYADGFKIYAHHGLVLPEK